MSDTTFTNTEIGLLLFYVGMAIVALVLYLSYRDVLRGRK